MRDESINDVSGRDGTADGVGRKLSRREAIELLGGGAIALGLLSVGIPWAAGIGTGGGADGGGYAGGSIMNGEYFYSYVWFDEGGWLGGETPTQGWNMDSATYFWEHYVKPWSNANTGQGPRGGETDYSPSVDWGGRSARKVFMDVAAEALQNARDRGAQRDGLPVANAKVVGVAWLYGGTITGEGWQYLSAAAWIGNPSATFTGLFGGHIPSSSELRDEVWEQREDRNGTNRNNREWTYYQNETWINAQSPVSVIVVAVDERMPRNGALEVKKVLNDPDDRNLSFDFTVTFSGANAPATQRFTLKGGQTWKMENIPSGVTATVSEATLDNFVQTWDPSNRQLRIESGKTVTGTVTNRRKVGHLKVSKVLDGPSKDHEFTFRVTIKREDGSTYKDETFRLKHGQSKTISNIPVGYSYTVTESAEAHFKATIDRPTGKIVTDGATVSVTASNVESGYLKGLKDVEI